jgi:hypothetical protein
MGIAIVGAVKIDTVADRPPSHIQSTKVQAARFSVVLSLRRVAVDVSDASARGEARRVKVLDIRTSVPTPA